MTPSPPAAHHQAPLTVVKHRRRHHQTMEPASPPSPLGAPSPPSGDDPSTNGADHHTAMMWKILQRPAFKPVDPTVVYEDGMMSLSFPRNVIQGALHIELTATIAMSETPTPGWLFFQLPGLALQNSCTGHFTFTLDTPGAHQTPKVVFDTDSLDADCITTPGSIAGPFSPRVPLAIALSLEKEEVRYLRDYELTTELHAMFSWSEERGLRVEYNALVLPEILDGDEIFADKVSFEFWIRDGLKGRVGDVLGEGNGHVVVLNEMREGAAIEEMDEDGDEGEDKGEETKITVSCAPEDLRKPINVLWAQELGNGERFDVVLPTFQTDEGSVFGKGMVVCNVEHGMLTLSFSH